jgi:hypothetical protein
MRARQTRRTQHIAYTSLALFCRVTFKPLQQIQRVFDTRQFEYSSHLMTANAKRRQSFRRSTEATGQGDELLLTERTQRGK